MPGMVAPAADERSMLFAFLAQQRYVLRLTAHGLTAPQSSLLPTAGALSIAGLLKHMAHVERTWMDTLLSLRSDFDAATAEAYQDAFTAGTDSLADLLVDYAEAAAATDAILAAEPDLDRPVPVPQDVPWFPRDVEAWSVPWVVLHLIEETARHAGHADLVREAIDGATAFPLMAAAEGWPATPWITPWTAGRREELWEPAAGRRVSAR